MRKSVALIIIYNHRFDQNIPVLENIYRDRFEHIFHLVPFYDESIPNVIPVYENSFYFQGYMSQAFRRFFSEDFEHFIFAADDLLLNPAINERNYPEFFQLKSETSFIPEVFSLNNLTNENTLQFTKFRDKGKYCWWRVKDAITYRHRVAGLENHTIIPDRATAVALLQAHGFPDNNLTYEDIHGEIPVTLNSSRLQRQFAKYLLHLPGYRSSYKLDYPLVGAYSDIVIVSHHSIEKFISYCAYFAATGLFVELAIPTALLLASQHVVTQPTIGRSGKIYWPNTAEGIRAYETDMQAFGYQLDKLLTNFPSDKLYIHPIKLSKWETSHPTTR